MNILIITTFYPPDTAIAAVRPYMFAKYLSQRGHNVTVLRSGEFYDCASDFFDMDIPVRVISYLGENCPAERYARGEKEAFSAVKTKRKLDFLPEVIRMPLSKIYGICMRPIYIRRRQREIACKLEKQKAALNAMKDEHFDVVFSTFGQEENIAAGQYAAKLFGCKLIQDFRDSFAAGAFNNGRRFRRLKRIQDGAIKHADGCTAVSEGLMQELLQDLDVSIPNMVLYNGFEPTVQSEQIADVTADVFSLCYTGTIYPKRSDMEPLLRAIKYLCDRDDIELSKVKLHYAGKEFNLVHKIAKSMGIEHILIDHGYVSRAEAAELQKASDLFLVLSWNLKKSQGILTGKFYEGIRAKKPILSIISGDLPNSELNILNEKYHYGFCYESCREKEQFSALCDYLAKAYDEKLKYGKVQHEVNPELEVRFRYDALAEQLEQFIEQL